MYAQLDVYTRENVTPHIFPPKLEPALLRYVHLPNPFAVSFQPTKDMFTKLQLNDR